MSDAEPRLLRHGRLARLAHAGNAVAILILLATGLAIGDWVAPRIVAWFGGHVAVNAVHQYLGLTLVAALVVLVLVWPRRVGRLAVALRPLRRGDARWFGQFVRFWWRRARGVAPYHDARFDAGERLVLTALLAAVAVAGVSGVYLYFLPAWGRTAFILAIRSHVIAAWAVIVLAAIHIAVGCGGLRTHRGMARAMFGDGTVAAALARRLWPGWAARQTPTGPQSPER